MGIHKNRRNEYQGCNTFHMCHLFFHQLKIIFRKFHVIAFHPTVGVNGNNESSARLLYGTTDVVGMTFELSLQNVSQDIRIVGIRQDTPAGLIANMNGSFTSLPSTPLLV